MRAHITEGDGLAQKDRFGRLRENRTALTKLLRDDRLTPNRRLLAFCMALLLDAREEADREFIQRLIEAVWVSPSRTRWNDSDDPQEPQSLTNVERDGALQIKSIFDTMLKETSLER